MVGAMKRLRIVAGMICFTAGFLTVIGGLLAIVAPLTDFTMADMPLLHHRPFSELALSVAPGVAIVIIGIALLLCSRALDERGAVRRYGKRKQG